MDKDIDAQFLCKDCARYNLCQYYDRRKEDSYICKYFHLSAEPCDDTISRQAAHNLMTKLLSDYLHDEDREKIENIDAQIADLPSVTPKQKMGRWISSVNDNTCSICGKHSLTYWKSKFCPNCGAKMEESEDTDGK